MKPLNEINLNIMYEKELNSVVKKLCMETSYEGVYHRANHEVPMPSLKKVSEIIDLLRTILFPGYFDNSDVKPHTMKYYLGSTIDRLFFCLTEQINRGDCFACAQDESESCSNCEIRAKTNTLKFIERLPYIREMLAKDTDAAYKGDPAAKQPGEIIFCYPSMRTLTSHRVAHELFKLDVQLIPRMISELSHSETGIDIHPGATIGEKFFIDHGTGVVIGETTVIGNNVRLYQGVTLGAKSFPLDERGNPIKGIIRHPKIEDDVIIYSGATILGPIKIGKGAEIGGNVWITHDVSPGKKVTQGKANETSFENGLGI
jgi:serine O-acetyltransferase